MMKVDQVDSPSAGREPIDSNWGLHVDCICGFLASGGTAAVVPQVSRPCMGALLHCSVIVVGVV